jgi:dissimilatory sulfite reductase (desulfoviridin) alpha/beta subunit
MAVMVIHVDSCVLSVFSEEALRQRTPHKIKCFHSDPVRPCVTNDHDIAIIGMYSWIVSEKMVIDLCRLQPIVTTRMEGDAKLNESLGDRNDVLLQIPRFVAAIEIDPR